MKKMFSLNSTNDSLFINPAYSSDQLEHEFNYTIEITNAKEFNILLKKTNVPYLSPHTKEIACDEEVTGLPDPNFKRDLVRYLNLDMSNNADKRNAASYMFSISKRFTTLDLTPLHPLNDTIRTDTGYCYDSRYGQNLHNYSSDYPIKRQLENCFICPESEVNYFPYSCTANAFEESNNHQVLFNNNPEYTSHNVVREYSANFGEETQYISPCNNVSEFNYSQSMQIDTKLVNYEKNINLNEAGAPLINLNNAYGETFTDRKNVHSNWYLCDGNQQPGVEVIDKYENDALVTTKQLPILETTTESLHLSTPGRAPIDLLEDTTCSSVYNASNFRKYEILERNLKHHIIPEGDDFVQMFQQVSTFEMCFLENKSVFSRNATPDLRGIGFDAAMLIDAHHQFETEHDVNEARNTENEILSKYPLHNKNYQKRY